ncbi:MAG: dUTP diphosphatase [Victivallales bacterium]|nr:dUTP diphosphatase [Victivallales bacterium]
MIEIKYKLAPDAQDLIPAKAHPDDAAFDLRSNVDMEVPPCKPVMVPTGLYLELPVGYEAQVRPRSGLAAKKAITVLNTPGTIDAGYRGEIKVILFNAGEESFAIARGDRIAQMVIQKLPDVSLVQVQELSETDRGAGGFGSTGKK